MISSRPVELHVEALSERGGEGEGDGEGEREGGREVETGRGGRERDREEQQAICDRLCICHYSFIPGPKDNPGLRSPKLCVPRKESVSPSSVHVHMAIHIHSSIPLCCVPLLSSFLPGWSFISSSPLSPRREGSDTVLLCINPSTQ